MREDCMSSSNPILVAIEIRDIQLHSTGLICFDVSRQIRVHALNNVARK